MMVTLAVSVLFRTCVKSYYIRLWNKSLLSYIYSLIFYIPRCKKVIYDRRCYGTAQRWPRNDRKGSERAFSGRTWYLKNGLMIFISFIITLFYSKLKKDSNVLLNKIVGNQDMSEIQSSILIKNWIAAIRSRNNLFATCVSQKICVGITVAQMTNSQSKVIKSAIWSIIILGLSDHFRLPNFK